MLKKIIIFILFIFLTINQASADEALVNIHFNLNNIATAQGMHNSAGDSLAKNIIRANNANYDKIIPYEVFGKFNDDIQNQTVEGRTVRVEWNIINYEPNNSLLSNYTGGYHLFDFTWFMLGLVVDYKDKNGDWTHVDSFPSTFDFDRYSKATISGYGDVPVILSPSICPLHWCFFGGQDNGEFNQTIEKEIIRDNYKIIIFKYPVTKSVYLMLNDSNLINKKLEISGNFKLGDNVINTEIDPFYYPFDNYSFNYIYTSYYPSEITINMDEIEDLDISTPKKLEFSAEANQNYENNITLLRKDIYKNLFWPVLLTLIGLIVQLYGNRWEIKWKSRLIAYIIASVTIIFTLPSVLNVPIFNLLNLLSLLCFIALLIFIEIKYRKAKDNNKRLIKNKKFRSEKYIKARKK